MADWSITIPLSDLAELMALPGKMAVMQEQLNQAQREIDGLRNLNGQALLKIADIKNEMRKSTHGG